MRHTIFLQSLIKRKKEKERERKREREREREREPTALLYNSKRRNIMSPTYNVTDLIEIFIDSLDDVQKLFRDLT